MKSNGIGKRIASLRKKKGLTQEQLAEKHGYARTTLGKMEAGLRDFKSTEIIALANYFNVSTDYLLGLTDMKANNLEDANAEIIDLKKERTYYKNTLMMIAHEARIIIDLFK